MIQTAPARWWRGSRTRSRPSAEAGRLSSSSSWSSSRGSRWTRSASFGGPSTRELEIRHLHSKLDQLLTRQWQRLLEIQQIQLELMEELARKGGRGAAGMKEW